MSVSRQNWLRAVLLFAICITVAAGYAWLAIKAYRAQRLAQRSDLSSIEKAIDLAPHSAEYHDQLCRTMTFVSQQPDDAVIQCREASELDPYNSVIWLDLAQAYYSIGNTVLTNAALRRALDVDPTTPGTLWSAANVLLSQGNTSGAMKQFAIVLREEPSLVPATLNICWQSLHDIRPVLSILPPNPAVHLAFIKLLLSADEVDAAHQVWLALMQLETPLDYHQGLFFIDGLLQAHAVAMASDAWKELASKSKQLQVYSQQGNLITNGAFSQEILNSGFDWRYAPRPQIAVTLDQTEFHSGPRSLRLVYGATGSDAGIFQYVAVQPDTRYRLSAWVKSKDIETANGPILTVMDGYGSEIYSSTEATVGTTAWHRVEVDFQPGPEANLVIVIISRRPGETRIQGTFWVDDVRLGPS